MVTKDLGMVTAYAYAVAGGYTGTEAEFTQLMADLAVVVDDFDNFSVNVTTLPAGSSATASYADGVLSLGIPKGDTGATGATGETGAPAGFGTVSATVDDNIGTPSVEVTASGADTAKNFAFAFHNLKGEKGDKGDTGEVSEAELTQAFADFSENGTVANAEQLTTDIKANDQTPYLFRTSGGSVDIGDREYINGIVGGTVAWNQLYPVITNYSVNSGDATPLTISVSNGYLNISGTPTEKVTIDTYPAWFNIPANHVYLLASQGSGNLPWQRVGGLTAITDDANTGKISKHNAGFSGHARITLSANTAYSGSIRFYGVDLTQMFGTTIADYIYSLEQANAGAGVAWFKKLFNKPYYAYNAGELKSVSGLVSHDMTGFNQWDGETESGYIWNGTLAPSTGHWRTKNYIPVVSGATYYCKVPSGDGQVNFFDADQQYVSSVSSMGGASRLVTVPANACYMKFYQPTSTDKNTVCINISWDGSRNGEYEEYELHSYPLDSDLTLRGIPKLDANNNLYYDGDVYEPDGTVTRKYGIVDLGTLTWTYVSGNGSRFNATISGIKRVSAGNVVANIVCPKFITETRDHVYNHTQDKTIAVHNEVDVVWVYDSAYTDVTAFKTAMNGVYLVYELAEPTEEAADPYNGTQIVDDFGTEEFVLSDSVFPVPVGHNTDYPINLKAKVEMMPNSPSGDGDYIVRQTNGENEYVALSDNETIQALVAKLPAPPSSNGTYVLTVTVSGSTATYSWEAQS